MGQTWPALELPPLYPQQQAMASSAARFNWACTGTKAGKTFGLARMLADYLWSHPHRRCWWVAPTYDQAAEGFRYLDLFLPGKPYAARRALGGGIRIQNFYLGNGSSVEFKSAEKADHLRGAGIHKAVIDECARIPYDSWVSVFTTLTQTKGSVWALSTPKGRGWFYDEWRKGVCRGYPVCRTWPCPHLDPEYRSWRIPTSANPHVSPEVIDTARRTLPERLYRQEYEAEFLEEEGEVFRHVRRLHTEAMLDAPQMGRAYAFGWDPARAQDQSVLSLWDVEARREVRLERLGRGSWDQQLARVSHIAHTWGAVGLVDATAMGGDLVMEEVARRGIPAAPVIFSNPTKALYVQSLAVAMEREEPRFILDEAAIAEMEAYEYEILPSGGVRYDHPSGASDDTVTARMLAWWQLKDRSDFAAGQVEYGDARETALIPW